MHIFCNHYGNQISDVYQGDSTPVQALISTLEQEVEFQDFFCTFNEVNKELNDKQRNNLNRKFLKVKSNKKI